MSDFFGYFLLMVSIFVWIVLTLISIFAIFVFLKWTVVLSFKLICDKDQLKYSIAGYCGLQNLGICLMKTREEFVFFLGKEQNKIISFSLANRKKRNKMKKRTLNILALSPVLNKSINWKSFKLNGEFGFNNPAQTGKIFGALTALSNGFLPQTFHVNIQPNFIREIARVEADTKLQFCPAQLAWRIRKAFLELNL